MVIHSAAFQISLLGMWHNLKQGIPKLEQQKTRKPFQPCLLERNGAL